MLSFIVSAYLGMTFGCSGAACAGGSVSASITITLNIVSVLTVNVDTEYPNPDVKDVYVLNITNFMAHSPIRNENGTATERYVVVDNPNRTEAPQLVANGLQNEIVWPQDMIAIKYEDKLAQDILVMVKKTKPSKAGMALAKAHKIIKKNKEL
jgi:hypothetical protein